jgi:hypothetical protein
MPIPARARASAAKIDISQVVKSGTSGFAADHFRVDRGIADDNGGIELMERGANRGRNGRGFERGSHEQGEIERPLVEGDDEIGVTSRIARQAAILELVDDADHGEPGTGPSADAPADGILAAPEALGEIIRDDSDIGIANFVLGECPATDERDIYTALLRSVLRPMSSAAYYGWRAAPSL